MTTSDVVETSLLTKIRYVAALAGIGLAAGLWLYANRAHLAAIPLQDPATPAFYLLSLLGLGLRLFWARYLVICFCASMLGINASAGNWIGMAGCGAIILLLSGAGMRQLFDERASRWNRWAGVGKNLARLKLLFVTQAVALGLLYGYRNLLHCEHWCSGWICSDGATVAMTAPLLVGGLGLVGLLLHGTWGVLLVLGALVLETIQGVQLATSGTSTSAAVIVLAAVVASLLFMLPLLVGIARHLQTRGRCSE